MSFLLDTNILTRMAQPDHAQYGPAKTAVNSLLAGGAPVFLVPQNLYEFWVVATRPAEQNGLGMTTPDADARVRELRTAFELRFDNQRVFDEWHRLVVTHDAKGKPAHDARLVSAMLAHGIQTLVTFNTSDFSRYGDVTVTTPSELLAPPAENAPQSEPNA